MKHLRNALLCWLLLCAPVYAAGEFQLLDKSLSGQTVYALLFSGPGEADAGEVWDGDSWEPLTDTWSLYDIALTETDPGVSGLFLGNIPAIGNKSVRWAIYQDANDDATPDSAADIPLAEGSGFWDTTHFAIRIVDGIGTGELDTASGTVIVGSFEDDAITGLSIQDGAFEATKFAAGAFESLLDFLLDDGTEVYDRTTDSMQAKRDLFDDGGTFDEMYAGSQLETEIASLPASTADSVWDELRSGHTLSGSYGQGIASVQGNVTGSTASVTAAVTVGTNNDKTGYRLSSTGVDDIWDEPVAAHVTGGTFGLFLDSPVSEASTGGLSVAEIADGVWDEARAGHVGAGSFGEGIASVQGNVTGSTASVTGAVGSVTGNVGGNVTGSVGSLTGHTPQTGDAFARLGAPAGASISADLQDITANVDNEAIATAVRNELATELARVLLALPNATPGGNLGLATVDANNFMAGIQGTLNTIDDIELSPIVDVEVVGGGPVEHSGVASIRQRRIGRRTDGTIGLNRPWNSRANETLWHSANCGTHLPAGFNLAAIATPTVTGGGGAITVTAEAVLGEDAKVRIAVAAGTAAGTEATIQLVLTPQVGEQLVIDAEFEVLP